MSLTAPSDFIAQDTVRRRGDLRSFFYLCRFALPWKGKFLFGFSLLLIAAGMTLLSAYCLGRMVEQGLMARSREQAWFYGLTILLLESGAYGAIFCARRSLALGSSLTILNIRRTCFEHLHSLPLTYFDRNPLGRTVTRITHDVEGIEDFFSSSLSKLVSWTLTALMSIGAMLLTDLRLGIITVLWMTPAVALAVLTRGRARELNREVAKRNSAINARLAEYINGLGVIRGYAIEDWTKVNYDTYCHAAFEVSLDLNRFYSWTRPLTELLCLLPLLALLWSAGVELAHGPIEVGLLVTFIRYCDRFARPMSELSREIHVIQAAFSNAERVTTYLRANTEQTELGPDGAVQDVPLKGAIEFHSVNLRYQAGGELALQNLSFSIEPGELVGLAGRTGSGKTSTVSLLTRLYEFESGEILVDRLNIRIYQRSFLRGQIGFVSQEVILLKGTIAENLDIRGEFSSGQVKYAAERSGLLEVLSFRGMDLKSRLLDQGVNLSGGERQLIALTRVLLRNPAILIMDEATANIDPDIERIIHRGVHALMSGRTTLIIAHRLDTLRDCQRILVFRDGRVVEDGSHQVLLDQKGYYSALVESGSEF